MQARRSDRRVALRASIRHVRALWAALLCTPFHTRCPCCGPWCHVTTSGSGRQGTPRSPAYTRCVVVCAQRARLALGCMVTRHCMALRTQTTNELRTSSMVRSSGSGGDKPTITGCTVAARRLWSSIARPVPTLTGRSHCHHPHTVRTVPRRHSLACQHQA